MQTICKLGLCRSKRGREEALCTVLSPPTPNLCVFVKVIESLEMGCKKSVSCWRKKHFKTLTLVWLSFMKVERIYGACNKKYCFFITRNKWHFVGHKMAAFVFTVVFPCACGVRFNVPSSRLRLLQQVREYATTYYKFKRDLWHKEGEGIDCDVQTFRKRARSELSDELPSYDELITKMKDLIPAAAGIANVLKYKQAQLCSSSVIEGKGFCVQIASVVRWIWLYVQ